MNKLPNSNTKSHIRSCRMFIPRNILKTGRGSTNHVVRRHIFHSHTRRTRYQSAVEKGRAHGESKWKGRKEGRNEWRREGRKKGGGGESVTRLFLVVLVVTAGEKTSKCLLWLLPPPPIYPSQTTVLTQEQKAACSQKHPKGKNLPNTSKTRREPFVAAVGGE